MRDQELDRWLDEALRDYANVEPRAGLDNRTLARVASQRRASARLWVFAMSVAVLAMFALLWLRPALKIVPAPEVHWAVKFPPALPVQRTTSATAAERWHGPLVHPPARSPVKKERFPSQSPLSDQEKMLAQFVQEFPQRAALIAQTQAELYEQDQEEMARPWPAKEHD